MPYVREGVSNACRYATHAETRRDNAIAQSHVAFRRHRTMLTINYAPRVALSMRCKELGGAEGDAGERGEEDYIKVRATAGRCCALKRAVILAKNGNDRVEIRASE